MDMSHDPPPSGNSPSDPPRPCPHLDWTSPVAVASWFAALRAVLADAHAVTLDLLRPLRERELGHVKHRELYGEAEQALDELLAFATPPDER